MSAQEYKSKQTNPTEFLTEYRISVRSLIDNIKCANCAEAVDSSNKLLDAIELNISKKLDSQLLAESLIALSSIIQALQTVYRNEKYEATFGMAVAFNLNMQTIKLLQRDTSDDSAKDFIVSAVAQITVTNTTLALWNDSVLRYYGLRVEKKVKQSLKAMYLYDQLLGSGISDLLLKSTQDKVEKKLKPFNDVGLDMLSNAILAYYACQTGNEKKRFLMDIEQVIENTDIIFKFMPQYFTLEDVRMVYELIKETSVDKSNYRKKIVKYCEEVDIVTSNKGYRPSKLYTFKVLQGDIWL